MPQALAIKRQSISHLLWPTLLGLTGVGAIVIVVNLTHDALFHGSALQASQAPPKTELPAGAPAPPASISLPEGKLKAAGIKVEPARTITLPAEVVVAGMIEPNPNRRVEIRPRAGGIIRKVNVSTSQQVKTGEQLALLESADVGTARLNVRARQLDLSIARTEAAWKSEIAANVEALIPQLRKGTPAATLEKQYVGKKLGAHRAELLVAYADLEIASHEEEKQTLLFNQKIVGEHPVFLALHTRESAQAKFEAALEQVRYDAAQQKRIADQQVRRAEAGVIDAVKRLEILLGASEGPTDPLAPVEDISLKSLATEDLIAYPLLAPFGGTIVTMSAVYSQRAEPTDVLFTLADLSTVYVVANIPESDFSVLPNLKPDGVVRVTAAAYPGRTFEAKVLFTGSMVDPTTRRLRLVAETSNPEGLWRLGMFVQIRVDSPTTERVLTVPESAVIEIDGRTAVFVPGKDEKTFTIRMVTTGREAEGQRVITAGLESGDRVVTAGAFVLKSELILQNEPEED
ncbi:MAG TPA: efflux RND transporter periplasmic adaptor subunit [Isosphaeraceae bacterium]|jgi:multidrug efflux pump subunit AcrA (membrane-fusion protein)|nr:efflux RND transporter periplasmic adaptor subunit [Isosphaeraceae bacterium]